MYFFMAWGLMVVIPAISVVIAALLTPNPDILWLVGKWFVFWGVGVRLLLAGVRQMLKPAFTARTIFRIEDPSAEKLVVEIGFGNIAMGVGAVLSLFVPAFTVPMALVGGIFLMLAGVKHMRNGHRSAQENTALVTDLVMGVIGIGFAVLMLLR